MNTNIYRFILLFLTASLLLSACARTPAWHKKDKVDTKGGSETATPIPRADPGFLQQLEKRAMLDNSVEMAKIVSGSHLGWRSSANAISPEALMDYADSWIFINPAMLMVDSRRSTFDYLSDSRFWSTLREANIKGLYISPTKGSGSLWASEEDKREESTGDDAVQYDFADFVGTEDTYRKLMGKVINSNALIGSDTIPAATGIGPDFMLAIRNVREYPGIYCLVDIPKELWDELPASSSEKKGSPISQTAIDKLSAEGLLPPRMLEDAKNANCGWAATPKVSGVDATIRRWVYRYYKNPAFPVLNWEDPSRAANRILSGSVVMQVGMQGQSLIGMTFDAFHGLEVSSASKNNSMGDLGSSLSAAHSMSREINRYGGWSWQRDNDLSTKNMAQILSTGVDFVSDHAFSPALEHALLTGDASLARYMAKKIIEDNVPSSRLVHSNSMHNGLSYSLPTVSADALAGNAEASKLLLNVQKELASKLSFAMDGNTLHSSSVGIAAAALGLPPDAIPESEEKNVRQGHLLLTFFRAMQPGLFMIPGQDLVGAMPLSPSTMSSKFKTSYMSRGTYSLTELPGSYSTSGQNIARTKNLYPYTDTQVHSKDSFIKELGKILTARSESGIAKGKIIAVLDVTRDGIIAIVSEIGKDKYMLTAANFGRNSTYENFDLGKIGFKISTAKSLYGDAKYSLGGNSMAVSFNPWQGKTVIFSAKYNK